MVFQIPLRLSVVYVDREKDAGFKGYQVPNTAIVVRSALPSSRSRQLQLILQVGCNGCPMVLQVLQDCIISIVLQIVLQVSFFSLISGFDLQYCSSAMAGWS